MKNNSLLSASAAFRSVAGVALVLALSLLAPPVAAQGTGHIQVTCEPGVQVFLNGTLQGITSAEVGGLILQEVAAGTHTLKVIKPGFNPQEAAVQVTAGKVFEFRVRPFTPKVEITERGQAVQQQVVLQVGKLLVQSLPVACAIRIPDLALESSKTSDEWEAAQVPVGQYTAVFQALGKSLTNTFAVTEGQTTHLFVNFVEGKVQDRSAEERARAAQEAAAAAKRLAELWRRAWTNTLGMVLLPIPGTDVLFCIWETRVRDYEAYAAANSGVDASWKNPGFTQGPEHPVVNVSWTDANAFCAWLTEKERAAGKLRDNQSYRLPRDWEWSVAVGLKESREGTPSEKSQKIPGVYPWGTQWPPPNDAGNYDDYSGSKISGFRDGYERTAPVGSFRPNVFGLFDLGGNVWEWCEDWYDTEQKSRVLRGASWNYGSPDNLLSSCRINPAPGDRGNFLGFRVVLVDGSSR